MEVRGELTLGAAPGARGSIKLTGGELIATNASLIIGSGGGEGVVTVTAPAATAQSRNTSKELRLLAGGGGSVLRARGVTVAAGSQGTLIVDGGTMTVLTDLIVGAVPSATGTVVVGTSLTVGGNFALLNNPRLELNLAGYGQGTDHGFIQVGNTATLAGDLAIRLTSGFANAITNGTSFTVLTARTIVGAFSNAPSGTRVATVDESGDFLVTYDGPSLLLGDFRSSAAP
jgi:hypothetical protein